MCVHPAVFLLRKLASIRSSKLTESCFSATEQCLPSFPPPPRRDEPRQGQAGKSTQGGGRATWPTEIPIWGLRLFPLPRASDFRRKTFFFAEMHCQGRGLIETSGEIWTKNSVRLATFVPWDPQGASGDLRICFSAKIGRMFFNSDFWEGRTRR